MSFLKSGIIKPQRCHLRISIVNNVHGNLIGQDKEQDNYPDKLSMLGKQPQCHEKSVRYHV